MLPRIVWLAMPPKRRGAVKDERGHEPSAVPGLGLAPDEVVLRGGFLKSPAIMAGCEEVGGAMYMPMLKSDPILSNFLSPLPCNRRPLRGTTVLEELQLLRNNFICSAGTLPPEADDDETQQLGLGGDASAKKRRSRAKLEKTLPPTVEVVFVKSGFPDWRVNLKLEKYIRMAPAMEVTIANLRALFARVRADLEEGIIKRQRNGGPQGAARKPRAAAGKRSYWKGKKWLLKERIPKEDQAAMGHEGDAPSTPPSGHRARRPRYRTLMKADSLAESPARRGRPVQTPKEAGRTEADVPVPSEEQGLEDSFAL